MTPARIDPDRSRSGTQPGFPTTWTWPAKIPAVFVAGVWAFMLLFNLILAWNYGISMPFQDEFAHVRLMTGDEHLTLGWLWEQGGAHRLPLAKLIWLSVLRLTNYNFRMGNCLSVLAFGALALAMIWAATAIRGRTAFSDAFFPLAVLNFSQAVNFLWWWQVNHLVAPLVGGVLLLVIVVKGKQLSSGAAVLAALCILLLPLCGPGGLPYALAGASWLGCTGILRWSSLEPHARRDSLLLLLLAGAVALLVSAYFINFTPSGYPHSPSLRAAFTTGIQIFSLGLGTATTSWWKFWGLGVVGLWQTSMALLALVWWREPQERFRISGLFLTLGAIGSLILVTGGARSEMPQEYVMMGHYVTLATPLLCGIYFVWELYGKTTVGRLVHMSLLTAMCILLSPNADRALSTARYFRTGTEALKRDLHDGQPVFVLAERHGHFLTTWLDPAYETSYVETLAASMRHLRRAGIDPFRLMSDDPMFREMAVPLELAAIGHATRSGTARSLGCDPHLTFPLTASKWVYAIRLRFEYGPPAIRPAFLHVFWKDSGGHHFTTEKRNRKLDLKYGLLSAKGAEETGLSEKTVTIWINDRIDQFCIDPDNKLGVFHLSEIKLLVPIGD